MQSHNSSTHKTPNQIILFAFAFHLDNTQTSTKKFTQTIYISGIRIFTFDHCPTSKSLVYSVTSSPTVW